MQLHEASEREKSIKKTYSSMMSALQLKKQSTADITEVMKRFNLNKSDGKRDS
jgi:hypothetical protein